MLFDHVIFFFNFILLSSYLSWKVDVFPWISFKGHNSASPDVRYFLNLKKWKKKKKWKIHWDL